MAGGAFSSQQSDSLARHAGKGRLLHFAKQLLATVIDSPVLSPVPLPLIRKAAIVATSGSVLCSGPRDFKRTKRDARSRSGERDDSEDDEIDHSVGGNDSRSLFQHFVAFWRCNFLRLQGSRLVHRCFFGVIVRQPKWSRGSHYRQTRIRL